MHAAYMFFISVPFKQKGKWKLIKEEKKLDYSQIVKTAE